MGDEKAWRREEKGLQGTNLSFKLGESASLGVSFLIFTCVFWVSDILEVG